MKFPFYIKPLSCERQRTNDPISTSFRVSEWKLYRIYSQHRRMSVSHALCFIGFPLSRRS